MVHPELRIVQNQHVDLMPLEPGHIQLFLAANDLNPQMRGKLGTLASPDVEDGLGSHHQRGWQSHFSIALRHRQRPQHLRLHQGRPSVITHHQRRHRRRGLAVRTDHPRLRRRFLTQPQQPTQGLHRLTQTHVVRQNAAKTIDGKIRQKVKSLDLIRPQRGLQIGRRRRAHAQLQGAGAVTQSIPRVHIKDVPGRR